MEAYNFVSSVFGQFFGLGHVSSWILTDCMGWTGGVDEDILKAD